jgi:putative FmdB family regulatory protein
MPIYEFYCSDCHTVYKFLARTVNTTKKPACPVCEKPELERMVSTFAALTGGQRTDDEGGGDLPDIDENRLEQAMEAMAREAGSIDEDDPKQAANLMRKLTEATGLSMGPGMEEAMQRMEQGEDPEKIEEEMGDLLENDELFVAAKKHLSSKRVSEPDVDDTLYDF